MLSGKKKKTQLVGIRPMVSSRVGLLKYVKK